MSDLKQITQAYLKSFSKRPEQDIRKQHADRRTMLKKIAQGKLSAADTIPPTPRESAKVMLEQVISNSTVLKTALERPEEPVISRTSWLDFSLLQGNGQAPEKSLLNRIKRTRTHAGACVMATELVNPKTDKAQIEKQQAGLRALQADPETTQQLDEAMKDIAATEDARTMMWQRKSEINHKSFQKIIKGHYFSWFGLHRLNRSPNALQCRKSLLDMMLFNMMGFLMLVYFIPAFFAGVISTSTRRWLVSLLFKVTGRKSPTLSAYLYSMPYTFFQVLLFALVPFYILLFIPMRHVFAEEGSRIALTLSDFSNPRKWVFTLYMYAMGWWQFYRYRRMTRANLNFIAYHVAGFQDLLRGARRISEIVAQNPDLEATYGDHLTQARALLQTKTGHMGKLVHNLEKANLNNRSYFFSHTGRLLVAYKLLKEHKENLADLIYEMGRFDVQLGLIKLMEEHQSGKNRNPITFGRFTEVPNQLPQLQAEGVWHPFLEAADAVPNDAEMDVERAFLIITGPNAGGKTTYILSLGVNSILNQCFGITYAKLFNQTIFYKIITYINVIQDLANGLSLAEAGMEVLRIHKEILNRTQQPMLAIVDEILNGVDPEVAKQYSYEILKKRSPAYLNCLTLVTTHLMNLTELAKEDKRFQNKKVVVKMPGLNGRPFDYTYRIQDGVTDQNVVAMMLAEKQIL